MEELRNPNLNVDMVKLFVGQIPKDMDEESLRVYFEEFGPLSELSIIRDSANLTSKGCAFVTYRHAESAQFAVEKLHDKVKLPNSLNALQVRIAETQTERENKLFIGMLPKTMNEQDLHSMFITYGELREVHIIRGPDGSPKGCAFVKFVERDAAFAAIEELNDTIPVGATRPLVVKFADTKKSGKKNEMNYDEDLVGGFMRPKMGGGGNPYDYGYPNQQGGMGMQRQQQAQKPFMYQAYPPQQQQNRFMYMGAGGATQGFYPPQSPQGYNISGPGPTDYGLDTKRGGRPQDYYLDRNQLDQMGGAYGSKPANVYPPPSSNSAGPSGSNNNSGKFEDSNGGGDSGSVGGGAGGAPGSSGSADGADGPHSRPPEGPSGANLFIYHLPRDLTDADLATLFAPFGNVISAKVFVDKKTSDSKGFGFVSYDILESANSAIESMNGFQIGSKRLKVQHKKIVGDDQESYPYGPGGGGGGGNDHNRQAYPPARRPMDPHGGGMNNLIGGMSNMNMYGGGGAGGMGMDMLGNGMYGASRGLGVGAPGMPNQNYSFMDYNNRQQQAPHQQPPMGGYHSMGGGGVGGGMGGGAHMGDYGQQQRRFQPQY